MSARDRYYRNQASTATPMLNVPSYDPRKIPAAPIVSPYVASTPDLKRIRFLTQEAAAPGIRKLRTGLAGALQTARRAENPNVQGLLGAKAISGLGEGFSSVMGGARREGMGLYAPEYAAMTEMGRENWEQERQKGLLDYEAIMKAYGADKPLPKSALMPSTSGRQYDYPSKDGFAIGKMPFAKGGIADEIPSTTTPTPSLPRLSDYLSFEQLKGLKTQGEVDAQKMKFNIPTGQSNVYDDYIKKTYLRREIDDLAAEMPMGG